MLRRRVTRLSTGLAAGVSLALLGISAIPQRTEACTGGALTAADGSVVVGRTLEFGQPLDSQIAIWPAGSRFSGTSTSGAPLRYRSRYGFVGATAATHSDMLLDGLNEKGLNVGLFYFPGYAQYTPAAKARSGRILAPAQISAWILANFATTEEVKAQIGSIDLTPQVIDLIGIVPDLHIKVQDASGRSIVIEPRGGRLVVHDNPTRVLTNAPTFDWHLTNLNNYVTLMRAYPAPKTIGAPGAGQLTLKPFGMGGGGAGLPGDFTPPSRFVRMVYFTQGAAQPANADQAGFNLFHILNNFDIPYGVTQPPQGTSEADADYTTWTTVADLKNLRFSWRTYGDPQIKSLDLRQALAASGGQLRLLPMGPQRPTDRTAAQRVTVP
ncbi:MAG: choloylglycine hydrolase family protein [Cyanobacteria bacterium REEB498]|nr:choloylglycine hydrolase family protein [Cyanobacteria bacterium REEB498]